MELARESEATRNLASCVHLGRLEKPSRSPAGDCARSMPRKRSTRLYFTALGRYDEDEAAAAQGVRYAQSAQNYRKWRSFRFWPETTAEQWTSEQATEPSTFAPMPGAGQLPGRPVEADAELKKLIAEARTKRQPDSLSLCIAERAGENVEGDHAGARTRRCTEMLPIIFCAPTRSRAS